MIEELVSIVVPVYNMGNSLEVCVDSLLKQKYYNIEIVLVDDGSRDNSLEVCYKLQNHYLNDLKKEWDATSILIGQAIMIPQAVKAVRPIKFTKEDVRKHIKPLLVFSISVIASFMYTVFDKTLLGIMSTKENVAFYEYSNKIVNVPKTIIGVTGTVMFPRACRLAAEGNVAGQKKYIKYTNRNQIRKHIRHARNAGNHYQFTMILMVNAQSVLHWKINGRNKEYGKIQEPCRSGRFTGSNLRLYVLQRRK